MLTRSSRLKAGAAIALVPLVGAVLLVAGACGIRSCAASLREEQQQREVIAYSAGVSEGKDAGFEEGYAKGREDWKVIYPYDCRDLTDAAQPGTIDRIIAVREIP